MKRTVFRITGFGLKSWTAVTVMAAMLLCGAGEAALQGKPLLLLGDKDYPPITYLENGVAKGVEVDLARELSTVMGRDIRVELMDWHLAQEKVLAGDADGLVGMSITEQRKARYDFATPMLTHEFSLFVRDEEARIKSVNDLAGMTVGVTRGGLPQQFMEARPGVTVVLVDNYRDGFKRLEAGRIDAVAADQWVAAYTLQANGIRNVRIAGKAFAEISAAIAVRKGNSPLLAEINRAIRELERTGAVTRIREAWRPQEIVFLSRERIRGIVTTAATFALLLLAFSLAIWIISLKRQIHERKKAEQALQESRTILTQILDSVPQGIFWKDRNSAYLGCNKVLATHLGFSSSAQVIGKTDFDLPWPREEAEAYRADDREVMEQNRPKRHIEEPMQQADGTRLWVDTSKVPLADETGMVYGVLGVFEDITERRRMYEALRESEERFRTIFEHAGIGIAIVDMQGRPVQCNPKLQNMLGYSEEEVQNIEVFTDVTYPDDLELTRELYSELCNGKRESYQLEKRFVTKSGQIVWGCSTATLVRNAEGEPLYGIGLVQDITESKQTEERLRESERKYRELIENANLIILRIDAASRVTFFNSFAQKFFGFTEEEVLGRSMFDTIVPRYETTGRDLVKSLGDIFVDPESYRLFENENVKKNGERVYVAWSIATCLWEDGAVVEILCIGQDITERQRLKEMMVQSEKMISLGGLAAGIAHELNSPLGSIVQNVQNIQRRIAPGLPANRDAAEQLGIDLDHVRAYLGRREILEMLDYISTAGRRAGEIIANMLTFSRKSTSRREAARLSDLIDKVLDLAAFDYDLKKGYDFRNIRIEREYDDSLPDVFLNPLEIEQVILNLLKNAAQALAGNPSDRLPRLTVRTSRQNGHAVMEIEDNGPGIPREVQGQIFEPFFTTKDVGAGTGLGLSVSFAIIVNNHNGTISVDSTPGEGSRFTIVLPIRGR